MLRILAQQLFIFAWCTTICAAQTRHDRFTITGKVIGRDTGRLILTYTSPRGAPVNDTVMLRNGAFSFSGRVTQPVQATLEGRHLVPPPYYNLYDPNLLLFYLEPGKMSVTLRENDYAHAVVTGSASQRENELLQKQLAPVLKKLVPLNNKYEVLSVDYYGLKKKTDTALSQMTTLMEQMRPLSQQVKKISCAFLLAHPNSYVSADILESIDPSQTGADSAMMYYKSVSKKIRNSPAGRRAYKNIVAEQLSESGGRASVGAIAPGFSLTDQYGNPVQLSSFRHSHYVLLDFWASWCVPCMNSNPRIKELYNRCRSKGLQVIGLSLDFTPEKWRAVLKNNALSWCPQIYLGDLHAPGNLAKEKYGIITIPQYILIDKNGTIIGRYDDPDEAPNGTSLTGQLKKIFP